MQIAKRVAEFRAASARKRLSRQVRRNERKATRRDRAHNPRVEQWIDAYWRTGDINLTDLDGAILKIAEGVDYLSEPARMDWLKTQLEHAKALGRPWQYYGFGRPDLRSGASDGAAEALDMLGTIEEVGPPSVQYYADGSKASVWIDLEKDCDAPKDDVREWLWAWFETVEAGDDGQWAGIYSSGSWLDDNIGSDDETMKRVFTREDGSFRPMWAARYGDSPKAYPPNLVKYPVSVKAPNWYLLHRSPGPVVAQWTSSREEGGTVNGKGHDSNLVYLR